MMDRYDIVIITIMFMFTTTLTRNIVVTKVDEVKEMINKPAQIQCYKQTTDHTSILHRITCPDGGNNER